MAQNPPEVIAATAAQTRFGALLRRAYREGQHFIVERAGLPVVAILPLRDYDALVAAQPDAAAPLERGERRDAAAAP